MAVDLLSVDGATLGDIDMEALAIKEPTEFDRIELELLSLPEVDVPQEHLFTPGLYCRKVLMRAGSLVTSRVHKMLHPFYIMCGDVEVLKEKEGGGLEVEGRFKTGYMGITRPGTKRLLRNLEDTVWVTCHPNPDNITDPDVIAELISCDNPNPLIEESHPRLNIWKKDRSPSIIHNLLSLADSSNKTELLEAQ